MNNFQFPGKVRMQLVFDNKSCSGRARYFGETYEVSFSTNTGVQSNRPMPDVVRNAVEQEMFALINGAMFGER